MNLRNKLRDGGEVQTSALNDILFILLFFFLIVATLANPNIIKLSNPKADTESRVKQHVVVSIDPNQQFYIGHTQIGLAGLKEAVSNALIEAEIPPTDQPIIVINADSTATAGSIVAVMRIAQELKAKTVMSVAKPD